MWIFRKNTSPPSTAACLDPGAGAHSQPPGDESLGIWEEEIHTDLPLLPHSQHTRTLSPRQSQRRAQAPRVQGPPLGFVSPNPFRSCFRECVGNAPSQILPQTPFEGTLGLGRAGEGSTILPSRGQGAQQLLGQQTTLGYCAEARGKYGRGPNPPSASLGASYVGGRERRAGSSQESANVDAADGESEARAARTFPRSHNRTQATPRAYSGVS